MDQHTEILADVIDYSAERDYVGWDKHDGMSSRIRQALPFETKWTNLAFQETIKRAPINLRPSFLVEQRPSPKGLCLFTIAALNAYEITDERRYLEEAESLVERVISHDLDQYDGFCLYHNHELQGLSKKTAIGTPGVVATSYGVKALLQAAGAGLKGDYPEIARSAVDYVESELHPRRSDGMVKVNYKPTSESDKFTLNANALAARLFVDLYDYFGDVEYREMAEGILEYVASRQEDIGGWEYKDPPSASHLGMDNYHNGFIIESFLRYQDVVDGGAFAETVADSLEFYRNVLYEDDGAPCWDETSTFPRDTHAAAQGIVTFTHAGNIQFARRIVDWTLENLYVNDGRFYYQKRRWYTKRFTLMRWCQAWMAYALSEYLVAEATSDTVEG